jgi:hypothetical protein
MIKQKDSANYIRSEIGSGNTGFLAALTGLFALDCGG